MKKGDKKAEADKLRKSAEDFLSKMTNAEDALKTWMPETDALKLIHEVEVHQVELEMQNEELLKARSTAEHAAEKYTALYDFAPIGYLTLSKEGRIHEINFFGAKMLGKNRSKLLSNVFSLFVTVDARQDFQHFLDNSFINKSNESCEITLLNKEKTLLHVHLSGIVSENGEDCNVIMLDITERKIAEEALRASFSLNEATLDSVHNGILVVNLQGQVVKSNARFAEMWRIPDGILSSGDDQVVLDFVLDQISDPDGFLARVAELYEQPEEECIDFIYFKDGRIFERISRPMYIDGEPGGRVWSFLDITEAKKVEEEKAISEANIRSLIENVDEIFIRYGLDLRVKYISPKVNNFLNLTPQDFIGKTHKEAGLQKKLATLFDASLKKVIATGKTFDIEFELEGRERLLYGESTIYPEFDSMGSVVAVVSITREITDRKLAGEGLEKIRRHYQALIDKAPDGFVLISAEGKMMFASPAARKMFGFGKTEEFLWNPADFTHPDDLPEVLSELNKLFKDPSYVPTIQYRFSGKKREWKWIESTFSNWTQDPTINAVIINFRDITERKKAQEALQASELKYRRLFENAIEGIFQTTFEGEFINVNPAFAKMFGYSSPEEMMKVVTNLARQLYVHSGDRELIKKNLLEHGSVESFETELYRKNREPLWVLINARLSYSPDGKLQYIDGTMADISEHIRAVDKLKVTNDKLNQAQRVAHIGSWENHLQTNELTWSDEMYHIMGFPLNTPMTFSKAVNVFPPEDLARIQEAVSAAIADNAPYSMDYRIYHGDGSLRYIHDEGEVIYDEDGKPVMMFGTTQDITERKIAEEALRESEERFRSVTESANDAIITTNERGIVLGWNKSAERIFGYTSEEMYNKELSHIIPPQYGEQHSKGIKRIEQGGISNIIGKTIELKGLHKSGKEIPVELSLAEWKSSSGKYFSGIIRDITTRKQAEKAIRESEESLKDIFHTVKEGIAYTTLSGRVTSINPALEQMVGISKEQIINKNLLVLAKDFLTFNNMKKVAPILTDLIQGKDVEPFQFEFRNKILEINVNINRQSKMMTGVVRDITERKQTERELILAKEKADEGNKLKTAFLQNISHEIRTPMNAIVGFSRMLEKKDLTQDKLINYTNIIVNSSEQLLSIVNDILTISALETRQEKINIQRVSVDKIISDLLDIFKIHPVNASVLISASHTDGDDPLEIDSDKTKIIQILTNLIANAQKFTHEGSIEFGYRKMNGELEFFVRDTGIGIQPEMRELIFDRFRQADNTISKGYGGTGLGLAISRGFVELLGGRIWVESELGKGSTFYFTIPYTPATR